MKKILLAGLLAFLMHENTDAWDSASFNARMDEYNALVNKRLNELNAQVDKRLNEQYAQANKFWNEFKERNALVNGWNNNWNNNYNKLYNNVLSYGYNKRPVRTSDAAAFVAKCLGKATVREMTEWEYNLNNGINVAPQLFQATVGGKDYIVRTVGANYDQDFGGKFDGQKVSLIKNTQKKLDQKRSGVTLAAPFQFAAFNTANKSIKLVNSSYKIGKYEVQMQLMPKAGGTELDKLCKNNKNNIKNLFDLGFLVGKGIANLHKIGHKTKEKSTTVHGDTNWKNIFVDQRKKAVTFIDCDRFGGMHDIDLLGNIKEAKHSMCYDLFQLLGETVNEYSYVPYAAGLLNAYQKTFPKIIENQIKKLDGQVYNMRRYLVYNIFYRSYGSNLFFAANNTSKASDKKLFDRVAKTIGLSGGRIDSQKFAKVMKIANQAPSNFRNALSRI